MVHESLSEDQIVEALIAGQKSEERSLEEERPPVPMSDRVKAINSVLDFLHDEEGMEQVETQLRIT